MRLRVPVLVIVPTAVAAISIPAWPQATIKLVANDAANAGDAKDMASGEVRRIEKSQKTITLKHGAISSISMPPMTMTFKVRDPSLLEKVRVGDKILFRAEVARDGTTYVVALEPVR